MASKKEVALLKDLSSKIKAVIETQAVLRDGMTDARRCLRAILSRIEDLESTSEVVKLSLRRKVNVEELNILEEKITDVEGRFSAIEY